MLIAYFCAEFALENEMPYAGGLGILAGDYILEAAEQKFPIVGIGLHYQKKQNGQAGKTNLRLVKRGFFRKLLVEIPIEDRVILAQVWQWKKKKASVYFLDTNIKENSEVDRKITEQLYVEDRDLRLKQELVLGVGGVRLLRTLKLNPNLFHLNEGHSAFLCLELIGDKVKNGANFEQAVAGIKKRIVFTNHTLVLEGQELFAFDALTKITQKLCSELNLNISEIIKLGQSKTTDTLFSMTTLALNMASLTNAVSKIHGEKARELWPGYQIIHITNGIYLPRWDKIKNKNIVNVHRKNEQVLLKLIRKIHGDNWTKDGLLVGWSRRFVPYKRPLALLDDVAKLKQLAKHFKGKIHIVYSAPLDEKDAERNEFLKRIYELMNGELKGLITFIPNYRIEVAETLVAGCDVWLNTPIVGREACGTSGMKAALNGTLNLSTNDGWIAEVALNDFGWIVDDNDITANLLKTLEERVLPKFENYTEWTKYMEKSRQIILEKFSTKRMLAEYQEKLYLPVINQNDKKLIAFDVDGTLSTSRSSIDSEMASLLEKLLRIRKVAIITGGAFKHIKEQVLDPLTAEKNFDNTLNKNLILLPTNGGGFFTNDSVWTEVSSHKLTSDEKDKIVTAIKEVISLNKDLQTANNFGEKIQDRGSEITFSALGENAPVNIKKDWDIDSTKRIRMQNMLMARLPEFEVKIGGTTSIDITPKGMDKAYGIRKLMEYFKLEKSDILFLGDAVYENGNDFPVAEMGVETIKVSGPEETKKVIRKILGI